MYLATDPILHSLESGRISLSMLNYGPEINPQSLLCKKPCSTVQSACAESLFTSQNYSTGLNFFFNTTFLARGLEWQIISQVFSKTVCRDL